jgi:hypothetical protein
MHLFAILLICQTYSVELSAADIHTFEIRTLLGRGLDTMKAVSRNSLMSLKARTCLLRLVQVFDEVLAPTSWQSSVTGPSDIAVDTGSSATDVTTTISPIPAPLANQTGDLSQYVTQAANDFLWEFSQNDLMDADFDLAMPSQIGDIWTA